MDQLFVTFHEHLKALTPEIDLSWDQFAEQVASAFVQKLISKGFIIPWSCRHDLVEELKMDVLEMTRKKTYGFYNLKEFVNQNY